MADNVTPNGQSYTVATDDDGTSQHQYVKLEYGADNTQTKVQDGDSALPVRDAGSYLTTQALPRGERYTEQRGVGAPVRAPQILFKEDFRALQPGVWNDGIGAAYRDCELSFDGNPTLRIDPQGNYLGGVTDPGTSPQNTNGVVLKRRIHDSFSGKFGMSLWLRFTSAGLTGSVIGPSFSIYNRDGTNQRIGRLWLDSGASGGTNNPMPIKYLSSAGTWTTLYSSTDQSHAANHMYDPTIPEWDRAGGWHYVKLVVDLKNNKYVSAQYDDHFFDLSAQSIYSLASTGFRGMHFSVEFLQKAATPLRYFHIAKMIGTKEP